VPTSLGFKSALTISALAFRIAENIVGLASSLPVEPVTIDTEPFTFQNNFFIERL
jgi:hypothetical protein